MKQKITNEAGMSLVELMLAAGVVATSLSILFGSLISIAIMERINEGRAMAATVMSSVMEELSNASWAELGAYAPPLFQSDLQEVGAVVECYVPAEGTGGEGEAPDESENWVSLPLPEAAELAFEPPLEMRITVSWRDVSGHMFEVKGAMVRGDAS